MSAALETQARPAPPAPGAELIDRLVLGYRGAKALLAAAALDLFTAIGDSALSTEAVSRKLRTKPRPTGILLDALAGLGLLQKQGGRYRNGALASARLVRGRPGYIGDILEHHENAWQSWNGLGSMLRTGKPTLLGHDVLAASPRYARAFIQGMDNIAARPAREIAARLAIDGARRILDVGAGPGAYTRALLARHEGLSAVLLDLPPSLAVARRILARSPLRRRVTLRAGSYHTADFGTSEFDVVLLSHITHAEDEAANRKIIRKSHAALRPGGLVVIHDFTVQEDGAGPLHAVLLSLHMMLTTGGGKIYSRQEYESWMREAGFSRLSAWEVPSDLQNPTWVMTGVKA